MENGLICFVTLKEDTEIEFKLKSAEFIVASSRTERGNRKGN